MWQHLALAEHRCAILEPRVWRGVENQYASATLQLVDSHAEHDLLETLLEASKPAQPSVSTVRHFLLTTPFRYTPATDSRFRRQGQRGLWYGALNIETVCAELAWWRMRFMLDSAGLLRDTIQTTYTFYNASMDTRLGLDLMQEPWTAWRSEWRAGSYQATQALADAATRQGIEVIRYESARMEKGVCFAVFTPEVLHEPQGSLDASRVEWICTAKRDAVLFNESLGNGRYAFEG